MGSTSSVTPATKIPLGYCYRLFSTQERSQQCHRLVGTGEYHRQKDCKGKATPKFWFCISPWQRVTAETSAIAGHFVGKKAAAFNFFLFLSLDIRTFSFFLIFQQSSCGCEISLNLLLLCSTKQRVSFPEEKHHGTPGQLWFLPKHWSLTGYPQFHTGLSQP